LYSTPVTEYPPRASWLSYHIIQKNENVLFEQDSASV